MVSIKSKSVISKYIGLIVLFFGIVSTKVKAQSSDNTIRDGYTQQLIEKYYRDKGGNEDLSLKPYYVIPSVRDSILNEIYQIDTTNNNSKNIFYRIFRNNLLSYKNKDVSITLNPLFNIGLGHATNGAGTISDRNIGFQLDINYKNKLFISASDYENNSRFPTYIRNYSDSMRVVPGMGTARISGKTVNYNIPFGHVGYRLNDNFYFEIGQDKNFFGSGYRSLLLSDYAYSYPYLKIVTHLGDFTYTNLWGQFVDASNNWKPYGDNNGDAYPKKYGLFNYLTYAGFKNLKISAFQSMIWANYDSLGRKRSQEWGYFVPIMYLNALNFNNGSPDNSVIGLDLNYQFSKNIVAYSQLVVDDFNVGKFFKNKTGSFFQEKYGTQLGVKIWDIAGIKNSYLQIEYNAVRPYTYANKAPRINYSTYNEPLAHPLGANFRELIVKGNYRLDRLLFQGEIMYAQYGADSANKYYGQNIHVSDYKAPNGEMSFGNVIGQGVNSHVLYASASVDYLMNPVTNSSFFVQLTHRGLRQYNSTVNDNFFYIGYRTSLRNFYKDF